MTAPSFTMPAVPTGQQKLARVDSTVTWLPVASTDERVELVNLVGNGITALVTLLAVVLGGWLSTRNQDRLWGRDHARQWRDIRLTVYRDFLSAYRGYIAFTTEPTANITAIPHPLHPGILMPFFDETGRPYKERLEATKTSVRLVSELVETLNALDGLVGRARNVAAARGQHDAGGIPSEAFLELWAAEREFLAGTRRELGLPSVSLDRLGAAEGAPLLT